MAVAACFGGPVLNLLLATGVPVLVQNAKMGTLPFKLSNGITILFACSMVRWPPWSLHFDQNVQSSRIFNAHFHPTALSMVLT